MAGFRTFATGEVLTAANVNDFLMKQSVMVFDDADARTAALGAEVAEGMLTFNKDTGQLEVFNGTDFVEPAPEPPPPTPQTLVAVKAKTLTTALSFTNVAAGDSRQVSQLDITHEVEDPTNRLIITATFGIAHHNNGRVGLQVREGSTIIGAGDAAGQRRRVSSGNNARSTGENTFGSMISNTFVHTPGAGSKTYSVHIVSVRTIDGTLFVNRESVDTDNVGHARGSSSLVINEVKA